MRTIISILLILAVLPILIWSCNKEKVEIAESEIVFNIPVKGDTILVYSYDEIMVYPNPFTDLIRITAFILQGDSATIKLSDENGEFIHSETLTTGGWNIITKDYPKGVYYIEVLKGSYVDRAKMLKIE